MFFGVNFEDPLQRSKSIKKQLEETVEKFGSTKFAKEQAANFLYKFYSWLPTAIKDITTTHKMRGSNFKTILCSSSTSNRIYETTSFTNSKKNKKN